MVNERRVAVLAYFFGLLGGILVYLIADKKDKFIRFHALQAILFNLTIGIVMGLIFLVNVPFMVVGAMIYGVISVSILGAIFGVLAFIVWVCLMASAWQGEKYKLPVLGELAAKWAK